MSEIIGNYKIEKHKEAFGDFPPESCWSVSELVEGSKPKYFAIVYEAMLTEDQARRAVAALTDVDEKEMFVGEPDDLAVYLEKLVFTEPNLKPNQCCVFAVSINCVCAYSYKCETHGERHFGTHE